MTPAPYGAANDDGWTIAGAEAAASLPTVKRNVVPPTAPRSGAVGGSLEDFLCPDEVTNFPNAGTDTPSVSEPVGEKKGKSV